MFSKISHSPCSITDFLSKIFLFLLALCKEKINFAKTLTRELQEILVADFDESRIVRMIS